MRLFLDQDNSFTFASIYERSPWENFIGFLCKLKCIINCISDTAPSNNTPQQMLNGEHFKTPKDHNDLTEKENTQTFAQFHKIP